jgi:hypothetical protein
MDEAPSKPEAWELSLLLALEPNFREPKVIEAPNQLFELH